MAIYRSDQAQLTFAAETAQGGDPEMMEGTLARTPTATLGAAAAAGSRTITLNAEFNVLNTAASAAVLCFGDTTDDAADTAISFDNGSTGDPELYIGQVLQVGSESMQVTAIGGTSNRDATVVRGFEGSTAAADHVDNAAVKSRFTPGDIIRIGTIAGTAGDTVVPHEVRRVESQSGTALVLDRPLAFAHASGQTVLCISAIGEVDSAHGIRNDNDKYITFIPGVYETVDTPDPEMSIEGRRFLSTQSKRNWSAAYPGQQSLTGSVSGITLLNGWPLRFPIGTVTTVPSTVVTDTILLSAAASKGDVYVACDNGSGGAASTLAAGDYIQIVEADGTNSEVRRILKDTSDTFKLNYPLHFDHANNAVVNEVTHSASIYYEHTITEATSLDTVSWHVHMKDSSETTTRNFDRRYVGGMIGSSTISAEEGGMVAMSWDSVNFLNMVHNQQNQKTVGGTALGDDYVGASVAANLPRFGLMHAIDHDDIGMPSHNGAALNDGTGYPTTSPYYFSEGTIKFFGQEFARIRSFSISISNGEEARYYIGKQGRRARGPYEIREGAREYGMSATVALPDADVTAAATAANADQGGALELFRQLLLEGDYGAGGGSIYRRGMTATLKFERGTNDYIIIDIPTSTTAGSPTEGTDNTNQLNKQGIFINSAAHDITGDQQLEVDLDMLFRSLKITIRDNVPVYP